MFRFDPYSPAIDAHPFSFYPRLRDELPGFWIPEAQIRVLSRYADIGSALRCRATRTPAPRARAHRRVQLYGAGYCDEHQFADPRPLRHRPQAAPPLGLGGAVHACLGTAIARLAVTIAFGEFHQVVPDCTARRLADGTLLRLESVHKATEQGKSAAAALLGQARAFTATPWFWSDQYDRKLQMAGLSAGAERWVVPRRPRRRPVHRLSTARRVAAGRRFGQRRA